MRLYTTPRLCERTSLLYFVLTILYMVGILVSEMKKKEKREQYAVAIVFSLAILAILIFFYNRQIRPNVLGTTDTTVTPVGGKEFFVPLGTGTNASTD